MFSVFLCCTELFPIKRIAIDSTNLLFFLHNKQLFLRPPTSSTSCTNQYSFALFSSGLYPEAEIAVSPASLKKTTSLRRSSNKDAYAVSYLINSCGLSPETAISAAEKVKFETPERPDKVLNLLRNHGFTETHITNLVRKRPSLLLANAEKTLLPKLLVFFQSVGVSRTDLAGTLSLDPTLLTRSLENQIIPAYTFLKSVLQSDKKVGAAMKRTSWIFLEDHTKNLVPNIMVLRDLEVPESSIALLLTHFPEAVMQKNDQFREIISKVEEMGFDPLKSNFCASGACPFREG